MSDPTPLAVSEAMREAVALTRGQFIVAMAVEIGRSGNLPARELLRLARRAYHAFENDTGLVFGDLGHAWDEDAARIIARQYETNHWEAA